MTNGFVLEGEKAKKSTFGTKMLVKVSEDDREGRYSLIEMVHPPNIGPALHVHPQVPEAYYILEGEYSIKCDMQTYQVKSRDFVFIPNGVPHTYQSGPKGGKVLVISPAGLEKYFTEVASIIKTGRKLKWEVEQEIASRYGQEFLDNLKHWGN